MIQVFSHSEPGGHSENQDAFDLRALSFGHDEFLCVVADGQGGQGGAALAAQLACKVCLGEASRYPREMLLVPETWINILRAADREVAADPVAGFTTIVAFFITSTIVCGASCGDGATLLVSADRHGEMLTSRQHKTPAAGSGAAVFTGFTANLMRPWTVLAMTDGVWKYAGLDKVVKAASLQNGEQIIRSLRERAGLPRTGRLQDDFTLVVVREDDTGPSTA
jgi:PPM family protein phosphatase